MAVALITGASQGIGACIAKRLAKDGFDVAINYYPSEDSEVKAKAVAEECRAFGVKAGSVLLPMFRTTVSVKKW